MLTRTLPLLLLFWPLSACQIAGPETASSYRLDCLPEQGEACEDPSPIEWDGTASASLDGTRYHFNAMAHRSAYHPDEVILHLYNPNLERAIQLSFNLAGGSGLANLEHTGYWSLGLCIPRMEYRPQAPALVFPIDSYDEQTRILSGRFSMNVREEAEPYRTLRISNGQYSVRLRVETFEYCIEG